MKMGFIGIGGVGGHYLRYARDKGFRTLEINSTIEDIEDYTYNHIIIGGSEGTNKSREKSKAFIKKDGEIILESIKNYFIDEDLIFVISSAGGGQGSGGNPLIASLIKTSLNKACISLLYLPNIREDYKYLSNCLETIKELDENNLTYCLLKDRVDVTSIFINLFKKRTPMVTEHGKFNLDNEERKYLFTYPGMISIKDKGFIIDMINSKIKLYYGINKTLDHIELEEENVGMEFFKGLYYANNSLDNETDYVLYAGGTPEQTYINLLQETIKKQLDKVKESKSLSINLDTRINDQRIMKELTEEEINETSNVEDIFARYNL